MTSMVDKRVLVTGANGFLGSALQPLLRAEGVELLLTPRKAAVDFTDQTATHQYLANHRPDIVIHLAAEVGGIGANRVNPGRYFYANMAMGLNLIESSRLIGVEKFVQIGTVCSYPKHTPVPFVETSLWDGYPEETNAPYGIAKKALLVMLQSYRDQYGFQGIYLLPANLYGPGDNFDLESGHVIPALIRKFVEARDTGAPHVQVWGTGLASREFLFVEDAARAIVLATQSYNDPEPINIGTNHEISIRELVDLIKELAEFEGGIIWDDSRPDGQPRRALDTSRAADLLGFRAEVDLAVGLRRTIEFWSDAAAARK